MKNAQQKKHPPLLWAGLYAILLLICFSIYGAFLGADKAQAFFNSIPLSAYWTAFTVLLLTAILLFRGLTRFRGLLMTHLGCALVLAGAIWGSQAGFTIQDTVMGTDTIGTGQMVLYEGMTGNTVDTDRGFTKTLPFSVRLADFRIEYYDPGLLIIQTPRNGTVTIPAQPGSKQIVSDDWGSVEIVRRFANFKIVLQNDTQTMIDAPNSNSNPALELRLTKPDGTQTTRYVFERFDGHVRPEDNLRFRYYRMVRDFISDLEIINGDTVLMRKSIEVNKPLHFGGYIFYQQGYDDTAGRFTILKVTNDRSLMIVLGGYILLCAGVFWHLWLRPLFRRNVLRTEQWR